MFDLELTRHLAELSKLHFTEEELQTVTAEMGEIVALMDTISEFQTEACLDKGNAVAFADLRKDVHAPSLPREEILANARERSETCFKVPKVV